MVYKKKYNKTHLKNQLLKLYENIDFNDFELISESEIIVKRAMYENAIIDFAKDEYKLYSKDANKIIISVDDFNRIKKIISDC